MHSRELDPKQKKPSLASKLHVAMFFDVPFDLL